jgi:hypothetical protein
MLMKLVRLIKMCLNKTYSKVYIGKHLSDTVSLQNSQKLGNPLSPLLLNFALEYTTKKVEENKKGLELNGTHHVWICADDFNLLCENRNIKKNTEAVLDAVTAPHFGCYKDGRIVLPILRSVIQHG